MIYPTLHCPTLAAKVAATRALYTMGFTRRGCSDVERGVEHVNADSALCYIYVEGSEIGFESDGERRNERDHTLVNSLPHMISFIKRTRLAPKP